MLTRLVMMIGYIVLAGIYAVPTGIRVLASIVGPAGIAGPGVEPGLVSIAGYGRPGRVVGVFGVRGPVATRVGQEHPQRRVAGGGDNSGKCADYDRCAQHAVHKAAVYGRAPPAPPAPRRATPMGGLELCHARQVSRHQGDSG